MEMTDSPTLPLPSTVYQFENPTVVYQKEDPQQDGYIHAPPLRSVNTALPALPSNIRSPVRDRPLLADLDSGQGAVLDKIEREPPRSLGHALRISLPRPTGPFELEDTSPIAVKPLRIHKPPPTKSTRPAPPRETPRSLPPPEMSQRYSPPPHHRPKANSAPSRYTIRGVLPSEITQELAPEDIDYIKDRAREQSEGFRILTVEKVDRASHELAHLERKIRRLREALDQLRQQRTRTHEALIKYLRTTDESIISRAKLLKMEENLTVLDTAADEWEKKLQKVR